MNFGYYDFPVHYLLPREGVQSSVVEYSNDQIDMPSTGKLVQVRSLGILYHHKPPKPHNPNRQP